MSPMPIDLPDLLNQKKQRAQEIKRQLIHPPKIAINLNSSIEIYGENS
jgi:hypothetical protein